MEIVVRWGMVTGLLIAAWLYVSYWLGLHTNGPLVFQIVPLGWLVLTAVCYARAMRAVHGAEEPGIGRGLKYGAGIAVITAALAILMQIGYYGVIHPEWPVFMVDQTRQYFIDQGASPEEIETRVAAARTSFTLPRYAASSAMAALVAGLVFSVVFTWVGGWRYRRRLAG